MKINRFFLAGLCSIALLASCSNDEEPEKTDPQGVQTYMTLKLVGDTKTRTIPGEDGVEDPVVISAEGTITSATILLCDPSDHKIMHVCSTSELNTSTAGVTTIKAKANKGTYHVYVIANPSASTTFTEGTDLITSKAIAGIDENAMQTSYAKADKFMMFSESNGLDDKDGPSITIEAGNDYTNPAKCDDESPILLDRLPVKIASTVSENITITGATGELKKTETETAIEAIKLQGFKLLNGAKQVYLQQHWTKNKIETGTAPWINTLYTPNITYTTNYYNNLDEFRTIDRSSDATTTYSKVKDLWSEVDYYTTGVDKTKDPVFCMENNSTYDGTKVIEALNGNTTGLIFQWQATLKADASDGYAGSNGFYKYKDKYYTSLAAIQEAESDIFDSATENKDDVPAAKLAAAQNQLATAYNEGEVNEDLMSDFRTDYMIKVYTNGLMYYTYYIKDQNYKQGDTDKEDFYYSVMRNTIYNLTVTELKNIGTDVPGGWNPETEPDQPIGGESIWMVVTAKVNKWVLSNEDIKLE